VKHSFQISNSNFEFKIFEKGHWCVRDESTMLNNWVEKLLKYKTVKHGKGSQIWTIYEIENYKIKKSITDIENNSNGKLKIRKQMKKPVRPKSVKKREMH